MIFFNSLTVGMAMQGQLMMVGQCAVKFQRVMHYYYVLIVPANFHRRLPEVKTKLLGNLDKLFFFSDVIVAEYAVEGALQVGKKCQSICSGDVARVYNPVNSGIVEQLNNPLHIAFVVVSIADNADAHFGS